MTVALMAETAEDESARHKRQRMSPPSPAPDVSSDPLGKVGEGTGDESAQTQSSAVDDYPIHSQQQSRLFQLPMELRDMIYDLACVNDGVATLLWRGSCRYASQDSAREPGFLQSCRLARQEGLTVFYQKNDFVVRRRDSTNFHPRPVMDVTIPFSFKAFGSRATRWLDVMSSDKIAKIKSVVLVQMSRGVYKDAHNEWRRDASACFRLKHSKRSKRGYEVEYIRVDPSGKSDRYGERLAEALEMRMEKMVETMGVSQWNRQAIWDMAYLL